MAPSWYFSQWRRAEHKPIVVEQKSGRTWCKICVLQIYENTFEIFQVMIAGHVYYIVYFMVIIICFFLIVRKCIKKSYCMSRDILFLCKNSGL